MHSDGKKRRFALLFVAGDLQRSAFNVRKLKRVLMSQISRNAPCPCGSGEKFKKCCLGMNEVSTNNDLNTNLTYDIIRKDIEEAFAECEELDNLSNSVLDLIQNGSFDEHLSFQSGGYRNDQEHRF